MRTKIHSSSNPIVIAIAAFSLAGCLTGGTTDEVEAPSGGGNSGQNNAPTISGSPQDSVVVGNAYSFSPNANDPDPGDTLSFSIENRPAWASFDMASGTLSGTPNMGDEGLYSNIRISVTDSKDTTSLPQFTVEVLQTGTGSTTLTWTAPMENVDSTPLIDLAGYNIYYGTSQGNYPNQIRIDNPGLTSYVVENLSPNTYYFVATAFNSADEESQYSNVAVRTVN